MAKEIDRVGGFDDASARWPRLGPAPRSPWPRWDQAPGQLT